VQDINLYQLLRFYAKKWKWIALLTIIGALAGFVYNSYIQVPLYKSDATLLLVKQDASTATQDTTLINNYIQLLKSRRVLEPVIEKQNNEISYEQLAASVTATNEKNTEVIKLSIATDNSQMSKQLVDGTIESFKGEVKEIYNTDNVRIVDNASSPSQPFNVNRAMSVILTTLSGFLLSVVALFFIYDFTAGKSVGNRKKEKNEIEIKLEPAAGVEEVSSAKSVVGVLLGTEIKKPSTKKKRATKKAKSNKKK